MEKDWWKRYLSEDGRRLNLRGTNLTSLKGVELPANLQALDLSRTELTSLAGVELPANLQGLNLDGTQIKELPESIRRLKKLEILYLSRMNLTALPDWLPELGMPFAQDEFDDGIRLWGTTVEGVDMSIFDQSQEDILRWFEARKKQRGRLPQPHEVEHARRYHRYPL